MTIDISYSETAKRWKIDNTPTEEAKKNSLILIQKIIYPLERYFKKRVNINSFYRCPTLNRIVGGKQKPPSQHTKGQAVDITIGGVANSDIFNYIKNYLPYDQLIQEKTWIHVSLKSSNNRKEIIK